MARRPRRTTKRRGGRSVGQQINAELRQRRGLIEANLTTPTKIASRKRFAALSGKERENFIRDFKKKF